VESEEYNSNPLTAVLRINGFLVPMNLWQQYLRPQSVAESIQALDSSPAPACLIAGGTDLMLDLRQGRHAPVHTLVDLNAIPEMTALEEREGKLFIGAAVPISRIAFSALANKHARALVEACHLIGGPQVRNMATLGGNVAHALPAADGTIAMMALDAQAEIADIKDRRRVPLADLFVGPGQSSLKTGQELLVGFYITCAAAQQASAFKRIMRAQGIALPILNLAVWLERKLDRIANVRIAVGPSGPTPQRIAAAEDILRGQPMTPEACNNALEVLLQQVHFRSSPHRASAEYRQQLVEILLIETLETAWQRTNPL
jgi:CO/xanthine dehydrogenase FAD-binding subunit